MRIAFITNNYTPYSGGVVSSIDAIVDELRNQRHEVYIITLDFLGRKHADPAHVFRIFCPIRFKYKKKHLAIPWRPTHQIDALIKQLVPDVIHVHHPFLLGKSGCLAGKKNKLPVVFTYHTMYEYYLHYVPLPRSILLPFTQKRVFNFCNLVDHVIVPSSTIQELLIRDGFDCRLVTKIPSPIQPIFLTNEYKVKQKTDNKIFKLLSVSRFSKEKNLFFLLDVMRQLPENFVFTLIGYGPQEQQLKEHVLKSGLNFERVQFIYKPEKQTIVDAYKQADIFLFSSKTDTQGLVLAEAMAASTPVVAIDGPGQRDSVINGSNGFIVNDQEQMIKKIIEIAQNVDLHKKLMVGAFESAQRYRSSGIVKRLVEVYNSLL